MDGALSLTQFNTETQFNYCLMLERRDDPPLGLHPPPAHTHPSAPPTAPPLSFSLLFWVTLAHLAQQEPRCLREALQRPTRDAGVVWCSMITSTVKSVTFIQQKPGGGLISSRRKITPKQPGEQHFLPQQSSPPEHFVHTDVERSSFTGRECTMNHCRRVPAPIRPQEPVWTSCR